MTVELHPWIVVSLTSLWREGKFQSTYYVCKFAEKGGRKTCWTFMKIPPFLLTRCYPPMQNYPKNLPTRGRRISKSYWSWAEKKPSMSQICTAQRIDSSVTISFSSCLYLLSRRQLIEVEITPPTNWVSRSNCSTCLYYLIYLRSLTFWITLRPQCDISWFFCVAAIPFRSPFVFSCTYLIRSNRWPY